MKIFLTNDDGIYAEGIYRLAVKLNNLYDVYIVAPDRQRSATGHAITMHHPLRAKKIKFYDTNIKAWAVDGTPSDCVKLGIEALLKDRPDIIISGINDGPNLGTDVLYSGTVSAAIEGAIHGIQSIAISMDGRDNFNYNIAADFAYKIVEYLKVKKLPEDTLLNINIPNYKREEIIGVKITTLGVRKYKNSFIKRIDPKGQSYYWLGGEVIDEMENQKSDIYWVKHGYITITPVHFDLTKFESINIIEKWNIKFE